MEDKFLSAKRPTTPGKTMWTRQLRTPQVDELYPERPCDFFWKPLKRHPQTQPFQIQKSQTEPPKPLDLQDQTKEEQAPKGPAGSIPHPLLAYLFSSNAIEVRRHECFAPTVSSSAD